MAGLSPIETSLTISRKRRIQKCQSFPRVTLICSVDGVGLLSSRQAVSVGPKFAVHTSVIRCYVISQESIPQTPE